MITTNSLIEEMNDRYDADDMCEFAAVFNALLLSAIQILNTATEFHPGCGAEEIQIAIGIIEKAKVG